VKPLFSFSSSDAEDYVLGALETPVTACISAFVGTPEKSERLALPGSGVPTDRCGERIPKHCKTHEGEFWGRSHCNERQCPNCYERWAAKEADTASLRIAWRVKYWQDRRFAILERKNAASPLAPLWMSKKALVGHFVVSMPDNLSLWIHAWSPEKALAMVYATCRRHRVCGGIVIFHPWRRDEDFEYAPDGYWHFHVIGLHFIPTSPGGSDFAPDGSPIVFKHIRDDEYQNFGGLRSGTAIARLIQYQLTHAGLRKGRQALTYFGLLHHSKVPKEKVQTIYPECLKEDSKTNPKVDPICPVDGSREVENCLQTLVDYGSTHKDPKDVHFVGIHDEYIHPDPAYQPSPEYVAAAEVELEEKFQNLYDNEPDPAARHKLTKERQRERAKLAQRELELFNIKNPLVAMWVWLRGVLENGFVLRADLNSETPELLDRVVELNLKTGRLASTLGGRLYLKHEYELDDALRDLRELVLHDEPNDGRDWRLERLLEKNPDKVNPIMTDRGFVFDEVPWPEHIPKTVEKVPALCYVCGVTIGNFVVDPDEDDGSSLPNVWCEKCKQKSLIERGVVEPPREDPGAPCVEAEDCRADRWRSSSPFSGGLE